MRDGPEYDELYARLGEFLTVFEDACQVGRHALIDVLRASGLDNRDLAIVLVADIPAWQILTALRGETAIVAKAARNEHLGDYASFALREFQTLIEERNRMIHSVWGVTFERIDNLGHLAATGFQRGKWRVTKSGLDNEGSSTSISSEDLRARVEDARSVETQLFELYRYVEAQATENHDGAAPGFEGTTVREQYEDRLRKDGKRFVVPGA